MKILASYMQTTMLDMKKVFTFILCGLVFTLGAQYNTDVRISPSTDNPTCYNIELDYQADNPSKLASQNYRIFYDSRLSTFDKGASNLLLPNDDYSFSVVQTNHDIDASGVGPLPFEEHLGFINASVLLNDNRLDGLTLDKEVGWTPTVQLCFELADNVDRPHIVLARKDLTFSYGRAFVELSVVDRFDAIQSLALENYHDLGL